MSTQIPKNMWTEYNPEYTNIIKFANTIECPTDPHDAADSVREDGDHKFYITRSRTSIRCSIRDKNDCYLGNIDWDPNSNRGTFYYSNEHKKIEMCICYNHNVSGIVISVAFGFNQWGWDISNQECTDMILSFLSTHGSFTKMVEDPEFMFQVEMMQVNK